MHLTTVLALLLAVAAPGPSPAADRAALTARATLLLRSMDPRERAHGADIVSRHGLREAGSRVLETLRRETRRPRGERDLWVQLACLDALIRTRTRVPPADLETLHPRFLPQVLVLTAADQATHQETLFRILVEQRAGDRRAWAAAGHLLVRVRQPGFALRAARDLTLRIEVTVNQPLPPGVLAAPRPPPAPPAKVTRQLPTAPPGYPAPVFWFLTPYRANGARDLVPGLTAMRVARVERTKAAHWQDWAWSPDPDRIRANWLGRLRSGGRSGLEESRISMPWGGGPPLLRAIRETQERMLSTYWSCVESLVRAGLLTEPEARSLRPRFEVRYVDGRYDKRRPLPPPPPAPVRNPFLRRGGVDPRKVLVRADVEESGAWNRS